MFISKVFSFFFVCMLSGCGTSISQPDKANQIQQKEKTELSLKMGRSGCYGTCPIYNLTVQSNGKVLFEGKGYTKTIGKAESSLSEEKMKELIAEIEKANFFSFDNAYTYDSENCPNNATDSATVTLFIKLNGKEKTITHYLGCSGKSEPAENNSANIRVDKNWSKKIFPQELYLLENKIDEIVETKRWIGEGK